MLVLTCGDGYKTRASQLSRKIMLKKNETADHMFPANFLFFYNKNAMFKIVQSLASFPFYTNYAVKIQMSFISFFKEWGYNIFDFWFDTINMGHLARYVRL